MSAKIGDKKIGEFNELKKSTRLEYKIMIRNRRHRKNSKRILENCDV